MNYIVLSLTNESYPPRLSRVPNVYGKANFEIFPEVIAENKKIHDMKLNIKPE